MIDLKTARIAALAAFVALSPAAPPALAQPEDARLVLVREEVDAEDDDWFREFLYEPEFVFAHAEEIGLTEPQRRDLIDAVVAIQGDVTRMELEAVGDMRRLEALLAEEEIDIEAVTPLVDRLLEVENDIKRRYLSLMIELHNSLSPAQRDRLDQLREE